MRRWQHADDRIRLSLEPYRSIDDSRIAVELFAPELVTEHHDLVGVPRLEAASERDRDAKAREVVLGRGQRIDGSRHNAVVVVRQRLFVLAHHVTENAGIPHEVEDAPFDVTVAPELHANER